MSSSETRPSKYTFLMVASKKKGDRQKLYIKKRKKEKGELQGGGEGRMKTGTVGNGRWTDLWREKSEIKLDQIVFN